MATSTKRSAFVARLYQDDEDAKGGESRMNELEKEMRVFDMDAASDVDEGAPAKKRDLKKQGKDKGFKVKTAESEANKVNRLVSLVLFLIPNSRNSLQAVLDCSPYQRFILPT